MRVLSGIQPSGKLHFGNYFGAIKQHLALHHEHDCYYFIANYHALTSIRDKEILRQLTFDVAFDYLALGLDPEKVAFYRQSDLPEVTELQWLLTTVVVVAIVWCSRRSQWCLQWCSQWLRSSAMVLAIITFVSCSVVSFSGARSDFVPT